MTFMEWVLDVAARHPDLEDAIISPDGEWLDILLPDGRTCRFRPSQLIDTNTTPENQVTRLNKLITIGVRNAQQANEIDPTSTHASPFTHTKNPQSPSPYSPPLADTYPHNTHAVDKDGNPLILPIVRSADYFLRSRTPHDDDTIAYLPLTDFIAVGLAEDYSDSIKPLFYSQLQERGIYNRAFDSHIHELFGSAIDALRAFNVKLGKHGVEIGMTRIAGARVFTFTSPPEYQSSWFADLDIIQQVATALIAEHPGNLPLFVPISRNYLQIVFADDPHLPDFFRLLYQHMSQEDTIYPLPHTVASDGWREWIPMLDHKAARILEMLRTETRARIYAQQNRFLHDTFSGNVIVKDYLVRDVEKAGRKISLALWESTDIAGSIPLTDFIAFIDKKTDSNEENEHVLIRTHVARDVWTDSITELENVWPPRLSISGFPDTDTLARMKEANRNVL